MYITMAGITVWAISVSSRAEGKIVAWSAIGAAVGVYLFFRGFRMLQFKRLVLNTPLSKVRSASMGLVELSGMAVGPDTIPAGITGDPCYYYRATAWELEQSGSSREWKQVASESLFVPFFVQDDTGRMLVNAQGADMDVHRNFKDEFGGSFFSSGDMPLGPAEDFMLRYGISGRHVRLEEYCIKPDYPLFVLGTLGENRVCARSVPEKHVSASSSSINIRWSSQSRAGSGLFGMFGGARGTEVDLDAPAGRPEARSFDSPASRSSQVAARSAAPVASSWSSVSMDEVHPPVATAKIAAGTAVAEMEPPTDRAMDQIVDRAPRASTQSAAQPFRQSSNISLPDAPPLDVSSNSGLDLNGSVVIAKGDGSAPFTISSESQRDLVRALGWKSTACIWGGPALTVTCAYILLLTLGLL
jgi:E3 ubiquitin ligase